jgi:probable rRNA maturation factor
MPVTIEMAVSELAEDEDPDIPDLQAFQQWADCACPTGKDVVASLQIVTRDEMKTLNKTYRNKDVPTNVLSFPMQLPDEVGINLLGDLVLCAEVISNEALEQGKSSRAHWAHMTVHGMLHLQGYDHIEENDAEVMEAMEVKFLKQLGFDNPYKQH